MSVTIATVVTDRTLFCAVSRYGLINERNEQSHQIGNYASPCQLRTLHSFCGIISNTRKMTNQQCCWHHSRTGGSLLEVLLATCILLVSMAAMGSQASVGIKAGIRLQLESESMWHCQTMLQETIASTNRQSTAQPAPIAAHSDWLFTTEIKPVLGTACDSVTTTVWKPGKYESISRTRLVQIVAKQHGQSKAASKRDNP